MPVRIRRSDHSPRIEMMPLIDVIFLLLTFFIYAMVVIRPFDVLPIEIAAVPLGEGAMAGQVHTITLDEGGEVFLDRDRLSLKALRERFEQMSKQSPQPQVFVALGRDSSADRAPVLLEIIGMAQEIGLQRFAVVGPKRLEND